MLTVYFLALKTPVQQWPSSTVSLVEVDDNKHKLLNLNISSPNGDVSLQFNAGSKETAEAIVAKIESSKRLANADGPTSPTRANGARSPTPPHLTIKSPTPAIASSSYLSPPAAHPGTTPSPSGKSRGVHFDPSPPVEIEHHQHGDHEDEEEEDDEHPVAGSGASTAIAVYDFDADGDDELSVKEGDKLVVIDKEGSEEWWKCRNSEGQEGVVPASYLEVRLHIFRNGPSEN